MTPQPPLFIAPADIVVLARTAAPLRFVRRQAKSPTDGATTGAGFGTFLELLTIGPPAGAVRSETERL